MEVTLHGFRTDRKKKMDCKQVQSGIIDFINDNMDIKEMEQFISHIENCEECREEYDVYYTLIMGMKLLDSDNLRGKTQIDSQDRIDDANMNFYSKDRQSYMCGQLPKIEREI